MINNSEKTLVSTFKGIATEENNINFFNDNKNKASKKSKTIFLSSLFRPFFRAGSIRDDPGSLYIFRRIRHSRPLSANHKSLPRIRVRYR